MSVYFITGKLGQGKTLSSVGRIMEYLNQGRRVATNLDLYPEKFRNKKNKNIDITRLPDKPKAHHLESLGLGYTGQKIRENRNGLIVLDECGTWFNSRNWNDKSRKDLIDWFLHARKKRWDIIFIVQDLSIIDKQARETLCEFSGYGKRLDKIRIPFFGALTKALGYEIHFPRLFIMKIYYGDNEMSMKADSWKSFGNEIFPLYDTEQCFVDTDSGNYSMLTPWHLVGRYQHQVQWKKHLSYIAMLLPRYILYIYLKFDPTWRPCASTRSPC
jgi:hypothetical protein